MNHKIIEDFVDFYQLNPPDIVLDDQGVRHINEIPLPAKYGNGECQCGDHDLESDTWYHKPMKLTKDGRMGVYRACKNCDDILIRKKIDPAMGKKV